MWIEIVLLLLIIWFIWNNVKKPSDYPPGPWGLPLIGCLPISISNIDNIIEEMKRKYGQIFSMRIGSKFVVFLCEYKIIQEALQNSAFANRPAGMLTFTDLGEDVHKYGIVGTNGFHWQGIRRFMLRHLRDLGMGKSKLVSAIHFEALELVEAFKKQAGKAAPITKAVSPAVINVLWQMVASKRYELDDKDVIGFQNKLKDFEHSSSRMLIVDIFPWLKTIVPEFILDRLSMKTKYIDLTKQLTSWFRTEANNHIKTLDPANPRDFIDEYLIEMEKQKNSPDNVMSYEDLIGCVSDLFTAGLETTTTTLNWAVSYLANFPEVQKKLQKEIDNVLPDGTPFTLQEKTRLPYLEAFISEVLRYSSLAAFSGLHSVLTDTKLGGYTIPKDSIILPMIALINYDDKYFDSPKDFKPERFLNPEGKFEMPKNGFVPFGTGKRVCLGESLARMELFIFLATYLQYLQFSPPENEKVDITPDNVPFFNQPKPNQKVVVTIRNQKS